MQRRIALLKGDGIGPEIVDAAVSVLDAVAKKYGHTFLYDPLLIGGIAIDETGVPLPKVTEERCLAADAVLLGAVGGAPDCKWNSLPARLRPEQGLLGIRKALGLYSNLRPAKLFPELADASPLKRSVTEKGIDLIIVRELTGGIYFGARGVEEGPGGKTAWDTERYSVFEIERIARIACELAQKRKKRIVSVDKANVLESSRLWRAVVHAYAEKHYPDVEVEDMLVDNAAMQLVKDPSRFDILLTSNMFGDILADEAAETTGSIGMLPSSSLGDGTRGLYEPIHGSAPDLAGKDVCNPVATILSAAMMLRDSFGLAEESAKVKEAVSAVLREDVRTADIASAGMKIVGCREMAARIAEKI